MIVDGLWQQFRVRSAHGSLQRRERVWALRDVSFTVDPGETFAIIGGTGSGKTTLARTLVGALRPTRGTVQTDGRVSALIDLAGGASRDLTGREHIMLTGVLLGMSRAAIRAKFDEIATFSGLERSILDHPLSSYSAGMGLRVLTAVLVASEPRIVVLDEVLAVADAEFLHRCIDRLRELEAGGCSVVLISHDLELIDDIADNAIVLDSGTVVARGDPMDIPGLMRRRVVSSSDEDDG